MRSFTHAWAPVMGWCAAAWLTGAGCTGDVSPSGVEGPVASPAAPKASDRGRGKRNGWWRGSADAGVADASEAPSSDGGVTEEPSDAGGSPDDDNPGDEDAAAGPVDAGGTTEDAGEPSMEDPPEDEPPPDEGPCVQARRLWFEDFETGDYSRWSSPTYGNEWGPESGQCRENGFSTDRAVSPTHSHRSEITCRSHTRSHRGYGGIQFSGDTPLPRHTNTGTGIDAPHGVVISYWWWLDVPYRFGGGRWLSPFTVNGTCDWFAERVITLGLEDSSHRLVPAHIRNTGGTVTFEPDAPGFPMRTWARITIYLNYHSGVMHVWQNGQSVVHATFSRGSRTMCHFHWGAYASGDNYDIVLYEDDISVWKLGEPWTDFSVEPDLAGGLACR